MGVRELIIQGILLICLVLAWIIGSQFVLPHLQVFPKLDPIPFWQTIYNYAFQYAFLAANWVACALVIFYAIYWAVRKFVPKKILFFKVRDRILDLTPLRELRETGIVGLFDRLLGVFSSGMNPLKKVIEVIRILASFVVLVVKNFIRLMQRIFRRKPIEIAPWAPSFDTDSGGTGGGGGGTVAKKETYNGGLAMEKGDVGSSSNDTIVISKVSTREEAKGTDAGLDNDGEPIQNTEERITPQEDLYIDRQYRQCLLENYKPITKDMTKWERFKAETENSQSKVACNARRNLYVANIISAKLS